jgi:hypothetical protein
MPYSWRLMDAVTCCDEGFLILVHKPRPPFEHKYDLKIGLVDVPAGARRGGTHRSNKMRDHLAARGSGDAKITVLEEIAQAVIAIYVFICVNMGKLRCRFSHLIRR